MNISELTKTADFNECLIESNKLNKTERSIAIIKSYFTQATEVKHNKCVGNDHGTDFIATNNSGFHARIDVKNWKKGDGSRVLVELMSSYENNKIGWSLDTTKNTEYICYIFGNEKHLIVPFPLLLNTCIVCFEDWNKKCGYEVYSVPNVGYTTYCMNINKIYFFKCLSAIQCGISPVTLKKIRQEELVVNIEKVKETCMRGKVIGFEIINDFFMDL